MYSSEANLKEIWSQNTPSSLPLNIPEINDGKLHSESHGAAFFYFNSWLPLGRRLKSES
jgi:hypothetical protein